MITNLLSNAIKFTAEGQVSLKVEASEGGVFFQVVDTGIGVPQGQGSGDLRALHPGRRLDHPPVRRLAVGPAAA